jgi:hypothetical protein
VADFDADGHLDLYTVQNSFSPVPLIGRFDGGLSQLLHGDGHGHFTAVPPSESGLVVPGDAKAVVTLDVERDGWPDLLVSRNNDSTLLFRHHHAAGRTAVQIRLRSAGANPAGIGARVTLLLADGSSQTLEVQAGSSYFSQSSPACFFGWSESNPARSLEVRWPDGSVTRHAPPHGSGVVVLRRK